MQILNMTLYNETKFIQYTLPMGCLSFISFMPESSLIQILVAVFCAYFTRRVDGGNTMCKLSNGLISLWAGYSWQCMAYCNLAPLPSDPNHSHKSANYAHQNSSGRINGEDSMGKLSGLETQSHVTKFGIHSPALGIVLRLGTGADTWRFTT